MNEEKDIKEMLLFDYVEGNLDNAEKVDLESILAIEPDLQDELSAWQSAYVDTDHIDTSKLEAQIIDATNSGYNYHIWSYLNLLLLVSFVFISGHEIQNMNQTNVVTPLFETVENLNSKSTNLMTSTISHSIPDITMPPVSLQHITRRQPINPIILDEFFITESMFYRAIEEPITGPLELADLKTRYKNPQKQPQMTGRQIRKRTKQIGLYKRKELERRQAIELMKGRATYVVPLDMKSF